MGRNVLMAVGAHADDIELSFAGTMVKYHEKHHYEIVYIQSTNNMSGQWSTIDADGLRHVREVPWYEMMPQRKLEAGNSARKCFHTEAIHLDHPQRHYTNRDLKRVELRYGCPLPGCVAPDTPSILTAHEDAASVDNLAKLILEKDPEVILTHPPADYTDEHTCTNMLVKKAFLNARKDGFDGSLVFYAVPPYLGYGAFYERWDSFIDTTGFHEKKLDAIACHACQMPDKNKVKLFDYERGERCGCKTAEAFTICELSESRKGELSKELAENHKFCLENWQKMIFSHKI